MNFLWYGLWGGGALLCLIGFLRFHPHYQALRMAVNGLGLAPWIAMVVALVLLLHEAFDWFTNGLPVRAADQQGIGMGGHLEFLPLALGRFWTAPWESAPVAPFLVLGLLLGWRGAPVALWNSASLLGRTTLLAAPVLACCWIATALAPAAGQAHLLLGWPGLLLQFGSRSFAWLASLALFAWVLLSLAQIFEKDPLAMSLDPIRLTGKRLVGLLPIGLVLALLEFLPGWAGLHPLPLWIRLIAGLEWIFVAPLIYLVVFLHPRPSWGDLFATVCDVQLRALPWFVWFLVLPASALVLVGVLGQWMAPLPLAAVIPLRLLLLVFEGLVTVSLVAAWFVLMQQGEFRAVGRNSEAAKLS